MSCPQLWHGVASQFRQIPSPILQLHWASWGHKPQQGCYTLLFRKCLNVAKMIPCSLSKTYPNAITPPPLPHAAGYHGHALSSLLKNVRQPSLRTKHSLWMCTRGGEQGANKDTERWQGKKYESNKLPPQRTWATNQNNVVPSAKKWNSQRVSHTVDPCGPSEVALSCRYSSVSAADKEGPAIHDAWGIHPLAPRQGMGQALCSVKFNCKFCQKRNLSLRAMEEGQEEEEKFKVLLNCR